MKTLKRLVATALLVLLASEAMANRVYRATKPYWWSQPAMKCHPPNDHGATGAERGLGRSGSSKVPARILWRRGVTLASTLKPTKSLCRS